MNYEFFTLDLLWVSAASLNSWVYSSQFFTPQFFQVQGGYSKSPKYGLHLCHIKVPRIFQLFGKFGF